MRVNFTATEHGFAFSNSFVNHVVRIPALGIDVTTKGRCGGMAATALDHWHAGLAMPESKALPQDGSLVGDYIYNRLIDTMIDNGAKFVQYATSLDHPTWLRGKGVSRMVREDELPRLKSRLNAGQPQLLCLTQARSITELGNDHQVVAYGYREDDRYTYVHVWDNRYPGQEITLKLTTRDDPNERQITGGGTWRGLFVGSYTRKQPSHLAEGRLIHDSTDPRIFVIHGGGAFWIPSGQEFDACGFSWSNVVAAKPGSMQHVATFPGNGRLVRERGTAPIHVVYGGRAFWIPSPQELEALGLGGAAVADVPAGSLAGLRSVPRELTLLRERSSDPVWIVQGGLLRHVTSQAVMDAYGLEWACVRIVPDGSLAALPKGAPLT